MVLRLEKNGWTVAFLLAFVATAVLFLWNIGGNAFVDYDEAAYANVVYETAVSGGALTLVSGGVGWFDKPPLYFWVAMFLERLFSPESAMRLASSLSGIATAIATALIAWQLERSRFAAFLSASILATTASFLLAARQARLDAPVAAAIALGFYFFLRALKEPRWFIAFGVATGVAVMTKGAIGLLIYPAVFLAAVAFRDFGWFKSAWFWASQGVTLLVAAPWYLYQTFQGGAMFWKWHLGFHVVDRFSSNLIGPESSILIYIEHLAFFASPWSLLFAAFLIAFLVSWARTGRLYCRAECAVLLPALFMLALFFVARTKIPLYLVPIYPFMAVFSALSIEHARFSGGRDWMKLVAAFSVVFVAIGLFVSIFRGYNLDSRFNIEQRLAEDEREIGVLLASLDPARTVYFADPIYWETVRFYSGGRELAFFSSNIESADESYYLIVPTYKVRNFPFFRSIAVESETLYRGEYFTLIAS